MEGGGKETAASLTLLLSSLARFSRAPNDVCPAENAGGLTNSPLPPSPHRFSRARIPEERGSFARDETLIGEDSSLHPSPVLLGNSESISFFDKERIRDFYFSFSMPRHPFPIAEIAARGLRILQRLVRRLRASTRGCTGEFSRVCVF